MQNAEIAAALTAMANLLEIAGENTFRIRAYRRAAETIAALGEPVADILVRDPSGVPGVGSGIADHIRELNESGTIGALQELYQRFPQGVLSLLEVPGVGPKLAARVSTELGVASVADLEAAARDGRLAALPRVGEKTAAQILRTIEGLHRQSGRVPLGVARPIAQAVIDALTAAGGVERLTAAGSVRRFQATVGDLDLVGVSTTPDAVMAALVALPRVERVLAHGSTKTSVLLDAGLQLDLRLVEPRDFGSLLQHFTGSAQHNILLREGAVARGLKISEYGISDTRSGETVHFTAEEEVYRYLGLQFIPPELRQGSDEVRLAAQQKLPRLVTPADIQGDLHAHTTWSDGSASIEEMIAGARARGYRYLAISDHSAGRGVANGLSIDRLRRQMAEIHAAAARFPEIQVFTASEVDIRADGSLDYPDEVLASLDLVVASVHSAMHQPPEVTTARLIRAIENPYVDIIGHLTTRLIGKREGIAFDRAAVFAAAARAGTALEVNAHPARLDLCDVDVRAALALGVRLAINTDAHSVEDLALMEYGIGTARRGGARAEDVWNCRPVEALRAWLRRAR